MGKGCRPIGNFQAGYRELFEYGVGKGRKRSFLGLTGGHRFLVRSRFQRKLLNNFIQVCIFGVMALLLRNIL
jgi:hypothetical protein